jgi:hypothetical protein
MPDSLPADHRHPAGQVQVAPAAIIGLRGGAPAPHAWLNPACPPARHPMNLLEPFNASAAKAFGTLLAETFIQAVPLDAKLSEKKFAQRAQGALNRLTVSITDFKGKNRLNTYKKAQLGNAFKWRLIDAGYETAYVDQLTEWLLERL